MIFVGRSSSFIQNSRIDFNLASKLLDTLTQLNRIIHDDFEYDLNFMVPFMFEKWKELYICRNKVLKSVKL